MDVNLVFFKKNGSRKIFPLPSNVTVIGRRHHCDLWVPLASVSKRHCQLSYSDGILKLRDLGSRNGTFLNGKSVAEAVVKAGDSITIGPLAFKLQIGGQPETIVQPRSAAQNWPRQDAAAKDVVVKKAGAKDAADKLFGGFAESDEIEPLDELDSLDDLDSFDELDSLDEIDSSEEGVST